MSCHALYGFCLLALGSLTNEGNRLPSLSQATPAALLCRLCMPEHQQPARHRQAEPSRVCGVRLLHSGCIAVHV